jgi:hypothetical protein
MDYLINVKELIPPMGRLKYYANVLFYLKGGSTTNNEINEAYGTTKEEARDKMEAKVKEWMSKNGK